MKIGDKILVTYSDGDQFAGRIYGETAKSWKVEFDNGDKRTIRKTMTIDVIPEDETVEEKVPVEEVVEEVVEEAVPYEPTKYVPSKKLKRKNVSSSGITSIVIVLRIVRLSPLSNSTFQLFAVSP